MGGPIATLSGAFRAWSPVTLDVIGPYRAENAETFRDFRLAVRFDNERTGERLTVMGAFAADGAAAESGAASGKVWRAIFTPPSEGRWRYEISFRRAPDLALAAPAPGERPGVAASGADGASGRFDVERSASEPPDLRAFGPIALGLNQFEFPRSGARTPLRFWPGSVGLTAAPEFASGSIVAAARAALWARAEASRPGGGVDGAVAEAERRGETCALFAPIVFDPSAGGDAGPLAAPFTDWPRAARLEDAMARAARALDVSLLDRWALAAQRLNAAGLAILAPLDALGSAAARAAWRAPALGPERRLAIREVIARFGWLNGLVWVAPRDPGERAFAQAVDAHQRPFLEEADLAAIDPSLPVWFGAAPALERPAMIAGPRKKDGIKTEKPAPEAKPEPSASRRRPTARPQPGALDGDAPASNGDRSGGAPSGGDDLAAGSAEAPLRGTTSGKTAGRTDPGARIWSVAATVQRLRFRAPSLSALGLGTGRYAVDAPPSAPDKAPSRDSGARDGRPPATAQSGAEPGDAPPARQKKRRFTRPDVGTPPAAAPEPASDDGATADAPRRSWSRALDAARRGGALTPQPALDIALYAVGAAGAARPIALDAPTADGALVDARDVALRLSGADALRVVTVAAAFEAASARGARYAARVAFDVLAVFEGLGAALAAAAAGDGGVLRIDALDASGAEPPIARWTVRIPGALRPSDPGPQDRGAAQRTAEEALRVERVDLIDGETDRPLARLADAGAINAVAAPAIVRVAVSGAARARTVRLRAFARGAKEPFFEAVDTPFLTADRMIAAFYGFRPPLGAIVLDVLVDPAPGAAAEPLLQRLRFQVV